MWILLPTDRWVRKLVPESYASSVYQNDDELRFSIGAGEEWSFGASLIAGSASGAPDIKCRLTFPAGSLFVWTAVGGARTAGLFGQMDGATDAITPTSPGFDIVAADNSTITIQGAVIAAASGGGIVQLQWAQKTASATAVIMRAGSSIWARRAG